MNIVVVGAGAIGSLFGALLSQNNNVVLLGRTPHVIAIQRHGLKITGETQMQVNISAVDSTKDVPFSPNILLLTVKCYDTETAVRQITNLIQENTIIITLQNGLDNVEKIAQIIDKKHILAGVTTYGAFFSKPGCIVHTGKGKTLMGELDGTISTRIKDIVRIFNDAGILTQANEEIKKELWIKAIINSSINPLTAFFQCKNGYLLENPILERTVEIVGEESTRIAQSEGLLLTAPDMIQYTKKVIRDTANNYSSMLQSIQQGKQTEIFAINGKLISIGNNHRIRTPLNEILLNLILSLRKT